jgi:hypothetical protein
MNLAADLVAAAVAAQAFVTKVLANLQACRSRRSVWVLMEAGASTQVEPEAAVELVALALRETG